MAKCVHKCWYQSGLPGAILRIVLLGVKEGEDGGGLGTGKRKEKRF